MGGTPIGREVRRKSRHTVDGNPSTNSSAPVHGGLRAAYTHDLVARPGEVAASAGQPLQGTAGEINRSEA
jgi:hypothetical protein